MRYRYVRASEIVDFADRLAKSTSPVVPITPWRARSQAENPDVQPGDTLLIVALTADEKVAGYIGLLPFRLPDRTLQRVFWNTCWWVDPDAGASASLALFSRFLKETGNRVAFSDMTEKTAAILRRLKGYEISSRTGVLLRFSYAYHNRILNSRKSSRALLMVNATGVFRLADVFLNTLKKRRRSGWMKENQSSGKIRMSTQLNKAHLDFARQHAGNTFTLPTIERFNWWKDNPWLIPPGNSSRRIARRYYFSALAAQNELFILECNCNDELSGFAIISNRNGVLKTHYLYSRSDSEQTFYQSLFSHLVTIPGAHTLVSFHEGFAGFVNRQTFPVVKRKQATRYTAMSESLKKEVGEHSRFQDGDGDYIFT